VVDFALSGHVIRLAAYQATLGAGRVVAETSFE
jgi:hypothetical protein